jgi:hypothetical protein
MACEVTNPDEGNAAVVCAAQRPAPNPVPLRHDRDRVPVRQLALDLSAQLDGQLRRSSHRRLVASLAQCDCDRVGNPIDREESVTSQMTQTSFLGSVLSGGLTMGGSLAAWWCR